MPASPRRANYRVGSLYSLVTALLLAVQAPFSAPAAQRFTSPQFICLTQFALLLSVPLITLPTATRRDFVRLLADVRNAGKLAILFVVGLCGLFLYNIGLSSTHPIITAAILNLSPFWAVLVAMIITRKAVPVSALVFFGCFAVAFVGAMIVAWSQLNVPNDQMLRDIVNSLFHSRWAYAIPLPLFFALSGTLVGRWFSEYDDSAAIAANFVVSAVILIPATLLLSYTSSRVHPSFAMNDVKLAEVLLLLLGTLAASAAGRVYYQVALTVTNNDNGFVTMFFLFIPAFAAIIAAPLSWWLPDLRYATNPLFFLGLALITIPLLLFLLRAWQSSGDGSEPERQKPSEVETREQV